MRFKQTPNTRHEAHIHIVDKIRAYFLLEFKCAKIKLVGTVYLPIFMGTEFLVNSEWVKVWLNGLGIGDLWRWEAGPIGLPKIKPGFNEAQGSTKTFENVVTMPTCF